MAWGTLVLAAALAQTAPVMVSDSFTLNRVWTHSVPGNGRTPVAVDPFWAMALRNEEPNLADGWAEQIAGENGQFSGRPFQGTYAYTVYETANPRTVLIEAPGSSHLVVNGSPRSGDPYGYGYLALPVQLKAGKNHIWAACGRGGLRLNVKNLPAPVFVEQRDMTLPDRLVAGDLLAGVTVVNGEESTLFDYEIEVRSQAGSRRTKGDKPLPGMSLAKIAVTLPGGELEYAVRVVYAGKSSPWTPISLRKRVNTDTYRVTFLSAIDQSVQYFAVRPPVDDSPIGTIILSLHGASVEAQGQAEAYGPHSGAVVVAATNRRPYGFDWEEVGRADALEVLALAREMWPNAKQTFLTGHSMGGHGTWSVGGHHPWEFDGIKPCASWRSFFTYGGAPRYPADEPIGTILNRASAIHDTFLVKQNYNLLPIFVLHGDADTTVPVSEPRGMIAELSGHPALGSFEEPGQGHWYDTDPAPGANCLDYAPGWAFLREKSEGFRKGYLLGNATIEYATVDPTAAGAVDGVRIAEVEQVGVQAMMQLRREGSKVRVTTSGVKGVVVEGSRERYIIEPATVWVREEGRPEFHNLPARMASRDVTMGGYGFKSLWLRPVTIVYGTGGNEEENRLMRDGARFLAETFLYRGNGSLVTMSDREALARQVETQVLIIGSPATNRAFMTYVGRSSVRGGRESVHAGSRSYKGVGFAAISLAPPAQTMPGMNGMISAGDAAGLIAALRVPFFTPGAAMPDGMILSERMLREGVAGVEAAGWFGSDWSLVNGDWTFRP